MIADARALGWIARLPLLGEPELGRLLGTREEEARELRRALEREGWIEWFVPGSEALRPRRLSFVRESALPALARALHAEEAALASLVPARCRDILERIVRVEITASVNRFLADLAARACDPPAELEDARSLPLSLPPQSRWWPPGVEAYGCLRAGRERAPFFVAWDRAAAPDQHRLRRVHGWSAARPAARALRGGEEVPPILVVCAGRRARAAWERALGRAAERADGPPLEVLLAGASDVASRGPAAAIWREPVSGRAGPLLDHLRWRPAAAGRHAQLEANLKASRPPAAGQTLRAWAPGAASASGTSARQRSAALAMTTDGDEKRMLAWIGRWPLVTAPQLASLAALPRAAVERRVDRLLRAGAVREDRCAPAGESASTGLVLAGPGLRLLARRDGVPPRLYARFSGVSAPAAEPGAVRHRAHQLGLNRALARLASDARAGGGRLAACRNEAQSACRFRYDGWGAWVRPDGSGVLALGHGDAPFLLEYDRGTLDSGDFAAKFRGYARYYEARAWRRDFGDQPALLFVCVDDRAAGRVARAERRVRQSSGDRLPVLLTTEWRIARSPGNPAGLMGPVWYSPRGEPGAPLCPEGSTPLLRGTGPDRTDQAGGEGARG